MEQKSRTNRIEKAFEEIGELVWSGRYSGEFGEAIAEIHRSIKGHPIYYCSYRGRFNGEPIRGFFVREGFGELEEELEEELIAQVSNELWQHGLFYSEDSEGQ